MANSVFNFADDKRDSEDKKPIGKKWNFETKKIRVYPLTPLFIGDGEEYNRLEIRFDEETQELVEFSQKDFVDKLTENEKAELGSMSFPKLANLVAQLKPEGRHIKISKGIAEKWLKEQKTGKFKNQFQIKKFIKDTLTGEPYIPGSSLKGALRTGFLSSLNPTYVYREGRKVIKEDEYLGRMAADAFSTLKVSDLFIKDPNIYILNTDRVSKVKVHNNDNGEQDGYDHLAVTMFEGVLPNSYFEGQISFCPKDNCELQFGSIEEILQATEAYSLSLLEDSKIAIKQFTKEEVADLKEDYDNKTYLVRLGGLIGAESHTIAGCRDILIKTPHGNSCEEYTSRTIYATEDETANMARKNFVPCGWCLVELVDVKKD